MRSVVSRAMNGGMGLVGFRADVFHNVDLSTFRPANCGVIASQQPKRGPHPFACRQLDSCLEAAIALAEPAVAFETCGGVIASNTVRPGHLFLERLDYEISVFETNILLASGVSFQLVITRPSVTRLYEPLGRVGSGSVRTDKLVAPCQNPVGFSRG